MTDPRRMPRLLYLFALINLVIGSSAFVIGGILEPLAAGLGVSVSAAGQSMTAYAVGTALLAPALLLATGSWPRRRVLLLGLALFAIGNAGCALAHNLPLLLAARVLMGAGAVFVPVAAGLAVALSEVTRRGQALSLVFLGMSLSYVVGVPVGAWLGLNHGWRTPIWLAAAASLLAALAVAIWVPRNLHAPGASFAGLGAVLRRADVLGVLGMTLAYFAAIFCVFAYIGPVFHALVPMDAGTRSLTLLLFGLGGVCGTLLGGWATDRFGAVASLRVLLAVFALALVLVPLTQGRYGAMVAAFMGWGVAGFGMMAPQQSRLAGASPAQAPLLLSLNSSMMYFGMAIGAAVGGALLPWAGFAQLSWVGLPFALVAYALLWATTHRRSGR